ncbi:hypothetical protein [Streptomyces sp. NPDC002853]
MPPPGRRALRTGAAGLVTASALPRPTASAATDGVCLTWEEPHWAEGRWVPCATSTAACGERGLYVLDGALTPGTTGARNPSTSIAAVVERAMDAITAHDIDTTI